MIKEAETRAAAQIADTVSAAEAQARELIAEAEKEARLQAEPLVKAQRDEAAALRAAAQSRLAEAVAFIKGKVVNFHASS